MSQPTEEDIKAAKPFTIGCLAVIGLIFALFLAGIFTPSKPDPWGGKEEDAIKIVQNHQNASGETILQRASAALAIARGSGTFIEIDGWTSFQTDDSTYTVLFLYKESDVKQKAEWLVDLQTKKVTPKNQIAYSLMF